MTQNITSISEFLLHAQTQYLILDLGRGISHIEQQTFFDWETQQAPCANPRQNHAWFCVVFWNTKASEEQYMWFLKLPLDENSLLEQASRNQFLEIVVKALGNDLAQAKTHQLPDNPYTFQPSQQQMADCRAMIQLLLNMSNKVNQRTLAYMTQPLVGEWQSLTVQDISDFVCQITESHDCDIQATIARNLPSYPQQVLTSLCSSLEMININNDLTKSLINMYEEVSDSMTKSLILRSMSSSISVHARNFVSQLISTNQFDIEGAIVIAGRHWRILDDATLLAKYFERVCELDNSYELFRGLYTDMVKVPHLRIAILTFIRQPTRSNQISAALDSLFTNRA